MKPIAEEDLCVCGKHEKQPPHSCPFKADVNEDSESLCECCQYCQSDCADDV